jgi:hypothetical protein
MKIGNLPVILPCHDLLKILAVDTVSTKLCYR